MCSVADLMNCSPPGFSVHGIFLTQGLNLRLLRWQAGSLPLDTLEAHELVEMIIIVILILKELQHPCFVQSECFVPQSLALYRVSAQYTFWKNK